MKALQPPARDTPLGGPAREWRGVVSQWITRTNVNISRVYFRDNLFISCTLLGFAIEAYVVICSVK